MTKLSPRFSKWKQTRSYFNFKQLWPPTTLFLVALTYDYFAMTRFELGRDLKSYLGDIRAISSYSKEFLGFTSLLVGLLVGLQRVRDSDPKTWVPVAPFLVALCSASFSIIFLPVPYEGDLKPMHTLWQLRVISEQMTVIFSLFGILGLFNYFMKMNPYKVVK